MTLLCAVVCCLEFGGVESTPAKHYAVGRIANPPQIPGRINNPSYIANNPGEGMMRASQDRSD